MSDTRGAIFSTLLTPPTAKVAADAKLLEQFRDHVFVSVKEQIAIADLNEDPITGSDGRRTAVFEKYDKSNTDYWGVTLSYAKAAALGGHRKVLALLEDREKTHKVNYQLNAETERDAPSPFHLACLGGDSDTINFFLEHQDEYKLSINAPMALIHRRLNTEEKYTPLMIVAKFSRSADAMRTILMRHPDLTPVVGTVYDTTATAYRLSNKEGKRIITAYKTFPKAIEAWHSKEPQRSLAQFARALYLDKQLTLDYLKQETDRIVKESKLELKAQDSQPSENSGSPGEKSGTELAQSSLPSGSPASLKRNLGYLLAFIKQAHFWFIQEPVDTESLKFLQQEIIQHLMAYKLPTPTVSTVGSLDAAESKQVNGSFLFSNEAERNQFICQYHPEFAEGTLKKFKQDDASAPATAAAAATASSSAASSTGVASRPTLFAVSGTAASAAGATPRGATVDNKHPAVAARAS